MADHFSIFVLAAGPGAMIGLMAMGLITIYRSSGVLYVAQPAVATAGAYLYVEFSAPGRLVPVLAVAVSSVLTGLLSVLIYQLVMRPLSKTAALTKLVASIGVTQILISLLYWRYDDVFYRVNPVLPVGPVDLPLAVTVGKDRLYLLLVAVVLAVVLWAVYRFTRFGIRTSAIAESPFFASIYGLRSARIANANWLIAGLLAGFAGSMLAAVTGISLSLLTDLIVPILAAALIGSMSSFPLALAGAIVIAYLQAEALNVNPTPGATAVVPFVILLAVMMVRGGGSVMRNFTEPRLPALGSGRIRWVTVVIVVLVVVVSVHTWVPDLWVRPLLVNLAMAIILLSVIVVTGFAGQLSLANMVLAGFGAFCAAHVAADWGWPFPAAVVVAVIAGSLAGLLQTIPAMRLKSVNFAVITLGYGVVIYAFALLSTEGLPVPDPTLFGLDISMATSPRTYVVVVTVVLSLAMIVVANLRRSRTGLRMITVRGNERVANALGINVLWTKAAAFAISGALAGLGGVLLSYQFSTQSFDAFLPWGSAELVSWATIGGVAIVPGAVLGATLAPAGLGTTLGTAIYDSTAVLGFVGGVLLILTLINHPDGVANLIHQIRVAVRSRRKRPTQRTAIEEAVVDAPNPSVGSAPRAAWADQHDPRQSRRALRVANVSVSFGGVHALVDVSFTVEPGTVHGLIGSNGSGKTTLLDAVSGFTRPGTGEVWLGDENISQSPAWRRARSGLGRSFQNGQLLADFTVSENLLITGVAAGGSVVRDLVAPKTPAITDTTLELARRLELASVLDSHIDGLTHGRRQLVSIARALAASPSLVLLDEPAAGLDDHERQEFRDLLRQLVRELNIGILLVEHDVDLVLSVCDVVTVLHNGKVIAEGTPAAIRESAEVRTAYLGEANAEPFTNENAGVN